MSTKNNSVFFLLLALLTIFLRLPVFKYTFLDVDESQFAGFAHVLLDGGLPYRDSLDTKPLLIYYFFAAIFYVFGKTNMDAVHGISLIINFGVGIILWQIGKRLKNEATGRWAACFWVIFSTCYLPKFTSTSITSIMVLPLCLSIWVLTLPHVKDDLSSSYPLRPERIPFLVSGIFIGIAFLFKYQAGIQLAIIGSYLLILHLRSQLHFKELLTKSFFLGMGFLIPISFFLAFLSHLGVWTDFVRWSLEGSSHYIKAAGSSVPYWHNLFIKGGSFILSTVLLWVLAFQWMTKKSTLIVLWFLGSLIPVCLGGRFYAHYFIQLLPALCLLAALSVHAFWLRYKYILLILILVPALSFWTLRWNYIWFDKKFPDDQIFLQEDIGLWLKNKAKSNQTLFVWGFATGIYFSSELKPASRFLWTDLLTGKVPGSLIEERNAQSDFKLSRPEAWEAFWEDMKINKPDYFVDTSGCHIHGYQKYPIAAYPELASWLSSNYAVDGTPHRCTVFKKVDS